LFSKLLKEEDFDIANLSDMVDDSLREKLLSIIMREEPVSRDSLVDAVQTYKGRIEERRIMGKINDAIQRGDEAARQQYYQELDALKRHLLNIKAENKVQTGD